MTTLTLKVPDELAFQLEAEASRQRVSKSEILRNALVGSLRQSRSRKKASAYDLMKGRLGVIRSGHRDLSTNKKHMSGFGR